MNKIIKIFMAIILIFGATLAVSSFKVKAKKVSYAMNTKKIYHVTYYGDNYTIKTKLAYKKHENLGYQWFNAEGDWAYSEKETNEGLVFNDILVILKYPIKKNKKWKSDGSEFQITSINKTLKTKAGTFKNVVIVKSKSPDSKITYTSYYAPNVGYILNEETQGKKTKKTYEVTKITKK